MRLVLDKIEEYRPGDLKLKQFAGDLANTMKSTYETKARPALTGGVSGAGMGGASFFESLGLTGIAKAYKDKQEAKEQKRQDKEQFVGNFQKYSEAGQTLSADTSRQVAESLFEEIADKRAELKKLQEEEARIREAGYKVSEENLAKQKELVEALKNLDPSSADKPLGSKDQDLNQIQKTEKEAEAAEIASEHFEVQKKEQEDITALYVISDDHFKKMDKRTEEMLEALKMIAENGTGGGGGGLLSSAADLLGSRGGAAKAAGKVGTAGKLASAAGTLGKVAKVGGGVLAVGTAAYDAYGDYQAADEKVKSGEITKEQGQVEKGKAVGGGVGAAGGALAGAKAGAMLGAFGGPVGMAIGGLLGGAAGYVGGKWLGQKAGGGAVQGAQSLSGTTAEKPSAAPAQTVTTESTQSGVSIDPEVKAKDPLYQKILQEELKLSPNNRSMAEKFADKRYIKEKQLQAATPAATPAPASVTPKPEVVQPSRSAEVTQARKEVQQQQDKVESAKSGQGSTTMVNAPVTNVSGGSAPQEKPQPKDTRNSETTYQKYLDRRYYPA